MAALKSDIVPPRSVFPDTVNFGQAVSLDASRYKTTNLFFRGGPNPVWGANNSLVITADIFPGDFFNLHDTRIKGNLLLPTANPNQALFLANMPPIERITLTGQNATTLLDLRYCQKYFQMLRNRDVSIDWFKLRDAKDFGGPVRRPSDSPQSLVCIPTATPDVVSSLTGELVSAAQLETPDCPQQLLSFPPSAAPVQQILPFDWALGELVPHSILGYKHDIVFPERVTLSVTFAAQSTWAWCALGQGSSQIGAVAVAVGAAGNAGLTDLTLVQPLQLSETMKATTAAMIKPGFAMPIPFLQGDVQPVAGTATSMGPSFALGGPITEVRKVYWSISGGSTSPWRTFDHSNIPGTYQRITRYTTWRDSTQITQPELNCTSASTGIGDGPFTDYEYNRDGKSPATLSRLTFHQNFVHCDDFTSAKLCGLEYSSGIDKLTIAGGIPTNGPNLTGIISYKVVATVQPGVLAEDKLVHVFSIGTSTLRWGPARLDLLI